ncbi:DgyrCDS10939 [Dimorphilus gyrociliatus]|uniref:DgyrCDS10939 n=1 Tax=Dimorphilus gyrociliatus TaxID=2664684 RepID=A0A7I8W1X3_9ANNE|nr:DgyrCDS10939 [Dimorphilus gyrociliatus]
MLRLHNERKNIPPSSSGRPASRGAGRAPGTATRLTTGMAPGTARGGGGQESGGGVALSSQVRVADRPMTKQGLGGMKTAVGPRRNQRLVKDRTYFLGLLRTKNQELSSEISNLQREADKTVEDQSTYVTYEKRAENLAAEIKECQRELGDYNTLVDKLNTEESINDIQIDYEDIKAGNEREGKVLDALFEQKQKKQEQISALELELRQEKSMADNMVADMPPNMKQKYIRSKEINEHLIRQLELSQRDLDQLSLKRKELDEELTSSPVKQEAVRLYEQLHDLEEKRDQLITETSSRLSPQEEREKLLKQVKEDNQEIAAMERQTLDLRDRISNIQSEIQQLDQDLEENQGAKSQKYRELKKREETMNEFLSSFEDTKQQEFDRIGMLEQNVVTILNSMSGDMQAVGHVPSTQELTAMREDLGLKEDEMKKSKTTASSLAMESQKLQEDLEKVETLEHKITSELANLKEQISRMDDDLTIYQDLDRLKREAEERKLQLGEDKINLYKRRESLRRALVYVSSDYDGLRTQLNDNETHIQLLNLERKWQHLEQNNFVVKEFIASKSHETDIRPVSKRVDGMLRNYNEHLIDVLGGKTPGM